MNAFESSDYKEVLNTIIRERRKTQRGLSRQLSEHLGVHPTLVSQVLAGPKDFTPEQLMEVCEFLGFAELETKYLIALLQKERAGSVKLKRHFQDSIDHIRAEALKVSNRIQTEKRLKGEEQAIFYSNWMYSAVHLLTTLDEKMTFEKICKKLNLQPAKARQIVDFLVSIQMIVIDGNYYKAGTRSTHLDRTSPFLLQHHTNWRLKAIDRAENLSEEEMMYTANFSVDQKDFLRLREELMQVIQRFLSVVKDSPAEEIAQFNLDLFWIQP
jgi:uncharacterized protein (TIGR02147 family)